MQQPDHIAARLRLALQHRIHVVIEGNDIAAEHGTRRPEIARIGVDALTDFVIERRQSGEAVIVRSAGQEAIDEVWLERIYFDAAGKVRRSALREARLARI